ncbi:MAG: hypothetical protein RLZZ568_1720 [Cyanobacteriota bacterium]|jgi:hypothetical protein
MQNLVLPRLLAIAVLSTGSVLGPLVSVQAQYTTSGTETPFNTNEIDPLNQGFGNGFDPMSLIHNANLSRGRTGADFADDTQRSLNEAADQFKQMQQQRLEQMQQPATEPAIAPAPDQAVPQ